jgi:hypothetical protein
MRVSLLMIVCVAAAGLLAGSSPLLAQQKTVKSCRAEWQANKADNQAKGITERTYIEQCRSASPARAAAPAAAEPPTTAAAPPSAKPTNPPANARASAPAAEKSVSTSAGTNQFRTEALAKTHCVRDIVVWTNLDSKIYHFSGHKDYGHTREGAYMCEKDAMGQGIRAAKNEKHP